MQTVGTFGKGVRGILLAGALVMVCGVLHAQVIVNFPDAENQLFITYISPGTEVPDETVTHTLGAGDSIVWTPYSTTFAEWTDPAPLNTNAATDSGYDEFPKVVADRESGQNVLVDSGAPTLYA